MCNDNSYYETIVTAGMFQGFILGSATIKLCMKVEH